MLTVVLFTLFLVAIIHVIYQKYFAKPEAFPPGPKRLPIFGGMMPNEVKNGKKAFQTYLHEEYGPVAGIYLG